MIGLTGVVVEEAPLAWFETAGWQVRNGAATAPGELPVRKAERAIKETTV